MNLENLKKQKVKEPNQNIREDVGETRSESFIYC